MKIRKIEIDPYKRCLLNELECMKHVLCHYTWEEGTSWGTAPAVITTDENNIVKVIDKSPSQEKIPTIGSQGWRETELRAETPYLPEDLQVGDQIHWV